jgi:hypothetical protein
MKTLMLWFGEKLHNLMHRFSYQALATGQCRMIVPPRLHPSWLTRSRFGFGRRGSGEGGRRWMHRRHCENEAPVTE